MTSQLKSETFFEKKQKAIVISPTTKHTKATVRQESIKH